MIPGAFTPRPTACAYGLVAFAATPRLKPLSLTTETNSLPRLSKRTIRPCKLTIVLAACAAFLLASTFRAVSDYLQLGFRLFSPRFRGTFQLSVIILLRYRTSLVFRVGCLHLYTANATQLPTPKPRSGTLDTWHFPSRLPLRGYHPLSRCVPADFESTRSGRPKSELHISFAFQQKIRFALCRFHSPLLTASQLLSLLLPTKMLQFGRFLFLSERPEGRESHSEIPGSKPACGSPGLIAACHVLLQLTKPSHPPSGYCCKALLTSLILW